MNPKTKTNNTKTKTKANTKTNTKTNTTTKTNIMTNTNTKIRIKTKTKTNLKTKKSEVTSETTCPITSASSELLNSTNKLSSSGKENKKRKRDIKKLEKKKLRLNKKTKDKEILEPKISKMKNIKKRKIQEKLKPAGDLSKRIFDVRSDNISDEDLNLDLINVFRNPLIVPPIAPPIVPAIVRLPATDSKKVHFIQTDTDTTLIENSIKNIENSDLSTKNVPKSKHIHPKPPKPRKIEETERTIFVGNVPTTVLTNRENKKEFTNRFEKYGKIETIRFRSLAGEKPSTPKRVAAITRKLNKERDALNVFIKYSTKEEALSASSAENYTMFRGHHLRVDLSSREKVHNAKRAIFVGNMPYDIGEEALHAHFASCGSIENVRIIRDKDFRIGKGFGYVTFKEKDAIPSALNLNGEYLNGRKLRIFKCRKDAKTNLHLNYTR